MACVNDPAPRNARDAAQYGLASGLVLDERPPAPVRRCPEPGCESYLTGGPAVFWCRRSGHVLHGGELDEAEERVARAAAVRAHELELERARHTPEYRPSREVIR